MGSRFIYLIRHGQYVHAKDEGELTHNGEEQAILTGKMLAFLPINVVHTSSSLRAVQTAAHIMAQIGDLSAVPNDLLRECVPAIPTSLARFYEANPRRHSPTPEEVSECSERLDLVYDLFFTGTDGEDSYELIVSHGNVIRYMITRALGVSPEVWVKLAIYNCGVSLSVVDHTHSASLITHNEVAHLPFELRTHS